MEIKEQISLKEYSTYQIGGKAEFFCLVQQQEDLAEALDFAKRNSLKTFFLGGGSNILFADSGFSGLVVKLVNKQWEITQESAQKIKIHCGAGVGLSELAATCAQKGWTGLEWATGIPGTVGGAVRGNAGAYGGEIKDLVTKVALIDTSKDGLEAQELAAEDCEFEYRSSIFKENPQLLVWEVELELSLGDPEEIKKAMREIAQQRHKNQLSLGSYPSAGCIFKNPVVSQEIVDKFEFDQEKRSRDGKVPAGWLIERCGLKGEQIGDAMVGQKQANFIVNRGNATSEDVIILISMIKMKVRNKFKVQLEEEVKLVM